MIDEWKLKYYCFSFFIIIKIKGKIIFYVIILNIIQNLEIKIFLNI